MGKRWWILGTVVVALALPASAGATGQVFWTNSSVASIGRANLNGSGGGASVPTMVADQRR